MVELHRLQTKLERLKKRYEALVRDAHLIENSNPTLSDEKMQASKDLLPQIKELELAQYN